MIGSARLTYREADALLRALNNLRAETFGGEKDTLRAANNGLRKIRNAWSIAHRRINRTYKPAWVDEIAHRKEGA